MDGVANNLRVILNQISRLDRKKADEFLECSSKLRANLSIYNKVIFDILRGRERPLEIRDGQATVRAAWDAANHDLFSVRVLLFLTGGSASSSFGFSRTRHPRTRPDIWRGQRCAKSSKGVHAKRFARSMPRRTTRQTKRSGQDPDEYLYIIDSCRDRLNERDPLEGPTDR